MWLASAYLTPLPHPTPLLPFFLLTHSSSSYLAPFIRLAKVLGGQTFFCAFSALLIFFDLAFFGALFVYHLFLVVFQRGLDSDPAAAVTCSSSYSLGSHPPLSSPQTKCLPTSPTLIYPLTISYSENQFCNYIPIPNILACIISYFCVLEPFQKHQSILYCMSWPTQWQ